MLMNLLRRPLQRALGARVGAHGHLPLLRVGASLALTTDARRESCMSYEFRDGGDFSAPASYRQVGHVYIGPTLRQEPGPVQIFTHEMPRNIAFIDFGREATWLLALHMCPGWRSLLQLREVRGG